MVASNYEEISRAHREQYGTDVGRYGGPLLVDRYDDRTHFIYELLQNAEDALRRRGPGWKDSRVRFDLVGNTLSVSHNGHPFTPADVRSICSIALSTKGDEAIGKFGIGFKSVYTFTDRPEIHSGDEAFAIVDYVHPQAVPRLPCQQDETSILLPLKAIDATAKSDLAKGLKALGPNALLFLRHITELTWSIEGGESGLYLRTPPEVIAPNVNRIRLIGESAGYDEVDQEWLVFSKDTGKGLLEIAFSLSVDKIDSWKWEVQTLSSSPLVVFFPTAHQTNLGFLVQGPFLCTPSRDNIRSDSEWNHHLIEETARLLVDSLIWLRDHNRLSVAVLRCLPLDKEKFSGTIFSPIFDAVKRALTDLQLLPGADGGYLSAPQAKLARTQELRGLLSPEQVSTLFETDSAAWISGDITADKEPAIRQYLNRELGIIEATPEMILQRMKVGFLEAQSDEWILRLYEFLNGRQDSMLRRLIERTPIVRLEDGSHVVAVENGNPMAFLPGDTETGFPTIRRSVSSSPDAQSFLLSLGITYPDQVDDVIRNVLPKYQTELPGKEDILEPSFDIPDDVYEADIARILSAFSTDSKAKREKLVDALKSTAFVKVIETGCGKSCFAKPGRIYIATDRLQKLFAGVPDIFIVNNNYDCLRGISARELLESCGALRYPRPIPAPNALTWEERSELRRRTGYETTSGANDRVTDWLLEGLDNLFNLLPELTAEQRAERGRLIWESLGELEERRGCGIFDGSYTWSHYGERRTPPFPAAFVRRLNQVAWVPNADGELVTPGLVVFDTLGWEPNPFLLTKITFKPPILDQLAKEAGIEPAILDLLRRNPAIVAELTSRLSADPDPETTPTIAPEPETQELPEGDVYDGAIDLYGEDMPIIPTGTHDPDGGDDVGTGAGRGSGQGRSGTGTSPGGGQTKRGAHDSSGGQGTSDDKGIGTSGNQGKKAPSHTGGRPFISYVGTHPDDDDPDPDGLDQAGRMRIEGAAIELIISLEPALRRTSEGNPGFDLYEANNSGQKTRWVEVKSMTGSLEDRPVGLSHTQFDFAREHGADYWLYIVENASNISKARILKIQDPAGHVRTFTFDRGWSQIALKDEQE